MCVVIINVYSAIFNHYHDIAKTYNYSWLQIKDIHTPDDVEKLQDDLFAFQDWHFHMLA